jgi:ribonucleotide reductase alpha subunit
METRKQTIEELKEKGLVPEWQTIEGYSTLKGGYLLEGEEPRDMYGRIAKTVAAKLNKPELEEKFFDYMWKGWLCPASPVCSNIGTERGLPISCFSVYVGDSVKEIMDSMTELALLSKHGGGVGMHWNDVRERGSIISNGNGKSDGVVPFLKIQDSTTVGVSQGGVRRGASASYLSIEHGDAEEFLNIRKPQGDVNRQTLNTHHGFCISDEFMDKVLVKKDKKARELWVETLKTRHETGEPYIFFTDNVAKNRPQIYKDLNLDVKGSNICCVSGDTLVLTKEGPQRIDSLSNKIVEVWDGINWVKNSSFKQRGVDSLYRVHISDGSYVDCNLEHRWFVAKNEIEKSNFIFNVVRTSGLEIGDLIEPVSFITKDIQEWNRIVKIEDLNKMEPVFCPELPTTGKFGLANGLMTGNTEIFLHTDKDHSFVCCLSSLNAAKYDEWKNSDLIYTSIWFLDGVMQEFIDKAKGKDGFERSVRFAEKSRALGLGLLGFHSLLQQRRLPFDHMDTFMLNAEIFRTMDKESLRASKDLAKEYGEPEWCKGYGVRNTHRIALAPTVSNSTISGNVSPSIEPWTANVFAKKSAKGTFITKNQELLKLLEEKGQNTEEVWNSITSNQGSVQHLDFLSQNEKEVFATAREINQFTIIKLAGQRQRWIDQGQSINIFFPSNVDPKYFHEIHVQAWKEGLNSLYYCRTSSPLKGDSGSRGYERRTIDQVETIIEEKPYFRSIDECKACEG